MFARQDRNGDGQIALDELDERARGFMQQMAQRSGLSESGPWKIDDLRKSMEERMGGGGGRDGEGDRGRDEGDRRGGESKEAKKPLVPGFGAAAALGDETPLLVPGFGIPAADEKDEGGANRSRSTASSTRPRASTATAARPSATASRPSGGSSSSSGGGSRNEERARTMIKSNDANNDGKLQPDEMDELIVKPKDTNGDGDVTVEEIAAQLGGNKSEGGEKTASSGGGDRPRGGRESRSSSSSSSDNARKSFRFLTPKERLPKGTPDWFVDADEDGDGQVLMAEYSDRWTESKATEFARRDKDGDGVITPREAASGGNTRDE